MRYNAHNTFITFNKLKYQRLGIKKKRKTLINHRILKVNQNRKNLIKQIHKVASTILNPDPPLKAALLEKK